VAQKARREVEAKAKEEAEKQRVAEEEERKKRTREYLQQLRDKVLEKEAALLEEAEGSQVAGFKHKEVAVGGEEEQWPSKKARGKPPGKYRRGAAVKMGGATPCERCVRRAGLPGAPIKVSNDLLYLLLLFY